MSASPRPRPSRSRMQRPDSRSTPAPSASTRATGVHLDGRGNDGRVWPDGSYTLTATAVDSNKQSVRISTEVEAVVGSVDLTGSSPVLHARQDQADRPVVRLRRRLQEADARGRAHASPMTCSIARSSTESSNGLRKISK